jgi:hypothetical protein
MLDLLDQMTEGKISDYVNAIHKKGTRPETDGSLLHLYTERIAQKLSLDSDNEQIKSTLQNILIMSYRLQAPIQFEEMDCQWSFHFAEPIIASYMSSGELTLYEVHPLRIGGDYPKNCIYPLEHTEAFSALDVYGLDSRGKVYVSFNKTVD